MDKLIAAINDEAHCAKEVTNFECSCTQDKIAVINGLQDIAKASLAECGEFIDIFDFDNTISDLKSRKKFRIKKKMLAGLEKNQNYKKKD